MGRRIMPLLAAFLVLGALSDGPGTSAQTAGTATYLALGDSIGFGVGASSPSTLGYVPRTFEALRTSERYAARGFRVVNLSVPGATSRDLLLQDGQLEQALAEIESVNETADEDAVEIVSINIGGNDLLSLLEPGSPCVTDAASDPCSERFEEVLSQVQNNLRDVALRVRESVPEATIVVLDLYNPYSGTGDPREALVDFGVAQLNAVTAVVAADEELDLRTAAIYRLFIGRGRQWISGDGIHPNDAGHAVIAEVLLSEIEQRPAQVPAELLAPTPGTVAGPADIRIDTNVSDDGIGWIPVLALMVPAFAAGVVVSAAFFLARGRPA